MKLKPLILLLLIINLASCNKDQNTNSNICSGAQPFNADFTITQTCPSCTEWTNYVCDTISAGQVLLKASLSYANSYHWQIGSAVYDSQTVNLTIPQGTNYVLPITLTVNKPPSICFPNDSSIHTHTQNMVVNNTTHSYYGNWQGYYIDSNTQQPIITNPATTITLTTTSSPGFYSNAPAMYGLQTIDSIVDPISYTQTYKELNFQTSSGSYTNIDGRAVVDPTGNNIQIYYQYTAKDSNTANYITVYANFQGTRL